MKRAADRRIGYRLRGEVDGVVRSFLLAAGENTVGSRPGNAVVLPVRGVSRRHALIRCDPEGLAVEDLGSKNGTLVRGARVQRGALAVGDAIQIGPVTLRLEQVDPDDVDIAIPIGAPGPSPEGASASGTTATPLDDQGRVSIGLIEDLVAHLAGPGGPDLAGVVTALGRGLGARSACVFEADDRGPIVIASYGAPPDLERHGELGALLAGATDGAIGSASLAGDEAVTCAFARAEGGDAFGVAVTGPAFVRRADLEAVLRVAVALLRPAPAAAAPRIPATEPGFRFPEGYVPGDSPAMRSFHAQLRAALDGEVPVLILGETGVGKEFVARIVHDSSPRRRGPFVAINCAAIPADLLEAELFGIGRGVATGVTERRGRFQMADRGTLFLDEIGDMPLVLQAKILRALQEKEVQPVGGAPVGVDIRVVAATNGDLEPRMEDGRFRRDLYFRVAGLAVRVPPLRERREDLPVLIHTFARTFASEAGKTIRGITVKALRALLDHSWPGNVRELQHEVRRLVYLCPAGGAIDSAMIPPRIAAGAGTGPSEAAAGLDLKAHTDALERRLIAEALAAAAGNRTRAARALGISRNGLAIKMERLGLDAGN
jgi:transcriptional regulator with AAA-type ATPase domain